MRGVFLEILGMSIMAGYVVLVVMLVRLPLKRFPKIYSYVLWAVVLFRLLCPFSIESAISFMPVFPEIFSDMLPLSSADQAIADPALSGVDPESVAAKRAGFTAAIYVWLAGITALLLHASHGYLRIKRRLQTATWVRDNIYETDRIITPFVLGFFRPKVYIPLGIQDKDYILEHEQTHIRRRDYLIKPVAYLALCLHWFNPVIWLGYFLMCKDMEMSCDERVLKGSAKDIRKDYSGSLLALSIRQSGLLTPSAPAFGDNTTKTRIKNVLKYRRPGAWISIAATIGILGITVGCVLNPIKTEIQSTLAFYAEVPVIENEESPHDPVLEANSIFNMKFGPGSGSESDPESNLASTPEPGSGSGSELGSESNTDDTGDDTHAETQDTDNNKENGRTSPSPIENSEKNNDSGIPYPLSRETVPKASYAESIGGTETVPMNIPSRK
ncbi:MAG: M56 family metallopeptidase [Peptococcaceae bacterium]|nr:M56 family metallopeptidase [Peptococcaceae bacterium]